jgi:hypothetical protein
LNKGIKILSSFRLFRRFLNLDGMGRTYLFECAKCGYRAAVAGGAAQGPHLAVQTIHCLDCRELHDAVTELKVPATAASLARWKLKPTPFDPGPSDEKPPAFAAALGLSDRRQRQTLPLDAIQTRLSGGRASSHPRVETAGQMSQVRRLSGRQRHAVQGVGLSGPYFNHG